MEVFALLYGSILMDASAYQVVVSYLKIVKENVFTAGIPGSTNGHANDAEFIKLFCPGFISEVFIQYGHLQVPVSLFKIVPADK